MSKDSKFQVYRRQFPVTAAEALTIHKSQSSTCELDCVSVKKTLTRGLLYVALSRVTKLCNLFIIGSFKAPPSLKHDDQTISELKRLRTQRQLKLCFNNFETKSGRVFGYHNVVSFPKYHQHIENDNWYRHCDILILAETQTTTKYNVTLQEFNLIFRSDNFDKPQKRGILIFGKSNIKFNKINHIIIESKGYHSDIVAFRMDEVTVITGYKTPHTPAEEFKKQLQTVIYSIKPTGKKILIGDFNIDLHQKSNLLSNFMGDFKMTSKLAPNASTTKYNTQIDVIFANFDSIIAGTYESYFSDHKPIYCMLQNADVTFDMCCKLEPDWTQKMIQKPIEPFQQIFFDEESDEEQNIDDFNDKQDHDDIIEIPHIVIDEDKEIRKIVRESYHDNSHLQQLVDGIITSDRYLTSDAMDHFTECIVSKNTSFDMQPTVFAQRPDRYKRIVDNKDDLQIIFVGKAGTTGHYVLITLLKEK